MRKRRQRLKKNSCHHCCRCRRRQKHRSRFRKRGPGLLLFQFRKHPKSNGEQSPSNHNRPELPFRRRRQQALHRLPPRSIRVSRGRVAGNRSGAVCRRFSCIPSRRQKWSYPRFRRIVRWSGFRRHRRRFGLPKKRGGPEGGGDRFSGRDPALCLWKSAPLKAASGFEESLGVLFSDVEVVEARF